MGASSGNSRHPPMSARQFSPVGQNGSVYAVRAIAFEFKTVPNNLERRHFRYTSRPRTRSQTLNVVHTAARQALDMLMSIRSSVISRRPPTHWKLGSDPTANERFQGLVDRGQTNVRHIRPNRGKNIIGSRVTGGSNKHIIHGCTLGGEPVAIGL
jgi:hypothetical protein